VRQLTVTNRRDGSKTASPFTDWRGSYTPNNGREDDSPSWLLRANSKKVVQKKVRPVLGGGLAAREPGLGTGRGGDVTELA
jgi:hypothetical protein